MTFAEYEKIRTLNAMPFIQLMQQPLEDRQMLVDSKPKDIQDRMRKQLIR